MRLAVGQRAALFDAAILDRAAGTPDAALRLLRRRAAAARFWQPLDTQVRRGRGDLAASEQRRSGLLRRRAAGGCLTLRTAQNQAGEKIEADKAGGEVKRCLARPLWRAANLKKN